MNDVLVKWKKFSTDAIEMMLPETFIGGHPKKDKRTLEEGISRQPENLVKAYHEIFNNKKSEFSAVEIHQDQEKVYVMLIQLVVEKLPLLEWGTSLESYMKKSLNSLGRNVEIGERGLAALQNYQAARAVTYQRENLGLFKKPGEVTQITWIYTIKEAHRFWSFFCATNPEQSEKAGEIFEQSLHDVLIKVK